MQNRKNLRRVSVLVNAQTLYHLEQMAAVSGYGDKIGKVVDDLVRQKRTSRHDVAAGVDTCVACGDYVPEGRMVCYACEEKSILASVYGTMKNTQKGRK